MVLPGELRTTEDGELQAENPYTSIFQGKLDFAALLEDQLQLLPEGLDPEADPTVLEQLFETARPQSEAGLSAHLRPCRDPTKDHLLSTLHAMEAFCPGPFAALLDGLLLLSSLLLVGCMALSAAAVWALWNYIYRDLAIAAIVLLLLHLPATSVLLAMQLGGHHCFTAWFMVLVYDLAFLTALPPLQRQRLTQRLRLARRFSGLPGMELWLWQYRACRQLMVSALLAVPMTVLGIVGSVRGWSTAAPVPALGVVVAASVVSALQAAVGFGEASLNARWAGQMSFLSYTVMALQLRGSKKLPYEWQALLAERRLVVKPDAPDFCELSRPQQCQLLRVALQRPHFAISNVVTHPRPPQKNAARSASAGQPPPAAAPRVPGTGNLAAAEEENCGWAAALKGAAAAMAARCASRNTGLATAGQRLGAVLGPVFSRITGARGACCDCISGCRRGSGSGSDSDSSTRPQAPPSACLLLQSKSAVKSVVGVLAGPLAAARSTLAVSEFSVNLVSFTDAAACKHCRTLLELVIRQGLRSLELCDSKLQLDFFGVLTSYLPSRHCVLNKLVLKDVMSSGISTLCMLCDGLARNSSVTHLDLSNNQLWGLRGAKELRLMLTGNGGLRVLLLPFCNITSVGAVEILRGAAECATLEQIDFSQNHIGDDVLDGSEVAELRNIAMREIDLGFNWIQDSLMGWTAALLETFPTLKRLHLNHNSDAAASRVASRAATPRMMTPRSLTPRTLTPSNLRIASYSNPPAAIFSIPSGSPAPAIAGTVVSVTSPSSVREAGQTFTGGSGSPQMLQPMQSTTVLSPCGSERLEELGSSPTHTPMQVPPLMSGGGSWGISGMPPPPQQQPGSSTISMAPPVRQATGTSAGPNAYNSAMTTITNNSSTCNALDGQAHTHAPATETPGRSRGQHLIVHLEHYVLQLPVPIAATTAGGGCSSREMNRRSLGRDSLLAAVPAVPAMHSGYSAASPMLAPQGPLVQGANLCAVPGAAGASFGLLPVGAGTTTRPTGSLWSAVAAMERLDLRGVPLPSWWARNPALRPASVLIDESMVYEEPPPTPAPVTSAPGFTSGGPSGGGGTSGGSGGGGLELPHHVVRSLEAGLAQGLVVIDLNSPEYKSISRCQQLVAIYTALQCATHITISNTTRIGGPATGILPVSALHSVASQQLQQQPLSGGGGLTLVRSATSSFARTNSGTAAFAMYAGPISGGGGCRMQSDTGYTVGCGGGSGGAMPLRPTPTLSSSSMAAVRGTVNAVNGGVGCGGSNGSMRMCRANSLRGSGSTALATALVASPPLGSLGSGDLGGGVGSASVVGRVSIMRRGVEGTVSSLHRFALERGGSSFTAPTASGGGGSKESATDGGTAVAVASAGGIYEPSLLPSANLGRGSANLYQHASALPSVRSHTGQTIQYHHNHRLDSFRKQLSLRNSINIPTASVNANQLLQSVLPYYPSPQAAALPGIDAARSVRPAAVLSGPWGSGPNTPGGTGGACLAGAFGSGIEGDGAASAPLVSQTNMLWSGQVVNYSSPRGTGSQPEHSKHQQHQRHQQHQELQQQQQGAPYVVRSRTIGTCLAVVEEAAAGGGNGGGAPCSAPCGHGGGGDGDGGSSKDPSTAGTAATPTAAELCYWKGAANALAEAVAVHGRHSLDQTAVRGSVSIGSTTTRAAEETAVCLQAVGLQQLLEDGATAKDAEGAAIAKELLPAGTSQALPLHSCVHRTSPNPSAFGLLVTTATATDAATTTAANPAPSGGSGGFGSNRLKPPPMATSMPVPAPAQSPRLPSVSFATMGVKGVRRSVGAGASADGDTEVNNAANADVQSLAGSTGSRQSSFLLVEGMAPEMFEAGLAILRGGSGNMAPLPIPADPSGTAAALEQQSAGPGPGSSHASQITEVAMRSLSSNSSSVKQTAAPMLPHPSPMSILVPTVHQDAPAGSFSFTHYYRTSLERGILEPTLDAESKCLPAPLSPLGASRALPLTPEPVSGSESLSALATAASSTGLQWPPLEVVSAAAAALTALWGDSDGADDGAGGVNRHGVGSSVDPHNGEEEDLEVSLRVEAVAMAAQRSLKNGSVPGSAGTVVDDDRLLSNPAAILPANIVGEIMPPLAEHSDGDGHGVAILAIRPGPPELVQFRSDLCNALSMHPGGISTPSSHRGAEPRRTLSATLLAAANAAGAAASGDTGGGTAAASPAVLTAGNGEGTDINDTDDGGSQSQAVSEAHEFADGLSAARVSPPYKSQPQRHSYIYGQTASDFAGGPHGGSLRSPSLVLKSIEAVATASHQNAGDATVSSVGGISVSRVFSRIKSASAVEPASSASPVVNVNTEPDLVTTTTEAVTDVGDDRGSSAAAAAATTIPPSANQQLTSPVFNAAAAAAAISGGVVSTGGTSCGTLRAPFGVGACGSSYIGVEASNAVTVVITVGCDRQLRVPLRCLELPLRAAMARRSGTTVSFRVTGLSHEGMRQLRALMAVAKVPVPDRTYAWLLPSQSMHQYTGNGYTTAPGGCVPVSCTSQPLPGAGNSQILHSASAAFGSGSGIYSGLGFMYQGGGPGSPTGLMTSHAISRMDSGAVYGGMPSYYFDNRGLPIDLGYILPPPTDSAEPSECMSATTHPATTVMMTALPSLARTGSTLASAAAAAPPADGCELSPPPQAPRTQLGNWTVSAAGLVAGASPLPLPPPPPPGPAPSSYELDPLPQQRLSPSWLSPHASTAAEGNGTADGAGRGNGGVDGVAEPNCCGDTTMSLFRASPQPMAMPPSSCSSTEDIPMQPPVVLTGEARLDVEAVETNRLNNYQSHHPKHHHGTQVPRRNPGGGNGPHNLPHGIMLVNLALKRPPTPPTPLLASSACGASSASPIAGHNVIRSNNNKHSSLNAFRNEGNRGPYDDDAVVNTSIGGAADDGLQHPLYMGTLEFRSCDLRVPSIGGVRCGGAFSGCGGLASVSSSAFGCQSLGSCIADSARDSTTPLASSLATPASIAPAADPWEHLDNRGQNDLTLGPFGSSIGVTSSSR
ncbi:hypothetical protein VaNZ11_016439 [Volvox africanus]|uniref:Guanylate cyclase domain-containing protein n=1 Tax=Volvox africanus TaxID=51714 RepID=A0ABQ5SPH5_9CHLO|nr:hypothetical protein VaNZ11_016439 [Volvox africanus]